MVVLKGKGVFGRIAQGTVKFLQRAQIQVNRTSIEDCAQEKARFFDAREKAVAHLGHLYEKVLKDVGEADAEIFNVHQMMLEDEDYGNSIENIICAQKVNVEYAVQTTAENFARMFTEMDDPYMKERGNDVKDISNLLLRILCGVESTDDEDSEATILAADDLVPSETVQMDKSKILAFILALGSTNSHTAILARSMGVPAIIGLGDQLLPEHNGKFAIVDGFTGEVYIDPDAKTIASLTEKQQKDEKRQLLLQELKGKPSITKSGKKISVFANIGRPSDVPAVLQNDAEGIGLFRSEFLYLENSDYPTEDEQFASYKLVAESMAGKQVIIRTMDIGADKQASYFNLPHEENPALGYRAIRICLTKPELFKTQLRAILRASAFGNLAIMFPMITSVEEVRKIMLIVDAVRAELREKEIAFDENLPTGIMIETPAAALVSDDLAKEVDFFSIGTNDLTQYTLAIDRQNQMLEPFYNPHHKAVLRLIEMVAQNAHENGIWVGICGELAADPALTATFVRMGIDELSVSPAYVLDLRQRIRETE